MGTRGLYGFRKDGIDKLTYNHFDSYPSGLGNDILEFCMSHSVKDMKELFDKIIMVNESSAPTEEQINQCVKNKWVDLSVSNQSVNDWYCLLRNLQGNLEKLSKAKAEAYMIDNHDFIKDSLWCEYAYIIDLDEEIIEFYEGFQKIPQKENKYGQEPNRDGYYPCKLSLTFSFDEINTENDVNRIVKMMELGEGAEDMYEVMQLYKEYDLTAEEVRELGDKKIIALWEDIDEAAEQEARNFGYLTDDNKRWFDLDLYAANMLEEGNYLQFEDTGRVVYYE